MTSLERLVATAKGKKTDRIPIFCNLLDQGAKELGMSVQEYYSKGEYVAEGQLRMREKYDYDNLWSLFFVGKEAELLGCKKFIFSTSGPPNVAEFVIQNYEDIDRLEIPDNIAAQPEFAETAKCLSILKKEAGGKYPICAYITASMSLPAILMGMGEWMDLLLTGPVSVRDQLLAKCSRFFQKQAKAYRDAGADIILYSNPFGSRDVISEKMFRELSLYWMQKDLEPGGVTDVVYYCGMARMGKVIDDVIRHLKIPSYYLSPMDNLVDGKKIIADRALCAGVIDDIKLIDWSGQQIQTEVKRILSEGMPGGRFLFGTGVMPYAIPDENIRIMLETARQYGVSP